MRTVAGKYLRASFFRGLFKKLIFIFNDESRYSNVDPEKLKSTDGKFSGQREF